MSSRADVLASGLQRNLDIHSDSSDDEAVELRKSDPPSSSSDDHIGSSSAASPADEKIYPNSKASSSIYYRDSNAVERIYVADSDDLTRKRKSPFRISIKEKDLYNIFKYTLLGFNGFLMLLIIGGVFIYFTEFRDKTLELNPVEEQNFLGDSGNKGGGPRYAWVTTTLAFALLLTIPCTGFVGALKEQQCLLIVYAVIFFVEAIVCLIFKTFWFLFPAFISVCALGLVFLQRSENNRRVGKSGSDFIPYQTSSEKGEVV